MIAGSARRILLDTPTGLNTRPTTDRTKETLFNVLQTEIADCRFLDLFAGSGAIAIEALSRGAEFAVLVERDKEALECIESNLTRTRLKPQSKVLAMEVTGALQYLKVSGEPFDIIFMDPPYNEEWEPKILALLADSGLCTEDTTIVVEAALKTDFSFVEELGFEIDRVKEYKTNKHVFLRLAV